MLFRQAAQFNRIIKTGLSRASWDTKELTIPIDERPILSIQYDRKYISVLGFHNKITENDDIVSKLIRNN